MATYNIKIGGKVRLEALLKDANGQNVQDTATWTSSATSVATVKSMNDKQIVHPITGVVTTYTSTAKAKRQKATVTGISAGTTTITVTNGSVTATHTVVVSAGTTVASIV